MDLVELYGAALIGALSIQLVAYSYALKHGRVDIIDAAWGLSFIAGVLAAQAVQPNGSFWVLLVEGLVVVWGLRLSWHIYARFRRSHKQDERYSQLIERWPKRNQALQLFLRLFLLQAILATTILLPVLVIHQSSVGINILTIVGISVWVVGFIIECIADKQLKDFLAQPDHGALLTSGLRRYSRHPNYFGEITIWWGLAIIALQTPAWLFGIIGASVITFLICFVSGVSMAEKQSAEKPGWSQYKLRTSILFPLPPKK